MKPSFGTCRGCKKLIVWVRTTAGKNMPCNPQVVMFDAGGGPETFITPDGRTVRGKKSGEGELGYTPHWATCPKIKNFKRK